MSKNSETVLRCIAKKKEILHSLMTPCEKCGDFDVAFMDWHHVDPAQKTNSVSNILRSGSLIGLLEETEKCICLCSNCHRKFHYYSNN